MIVKSEEAISVEKSIKVELEANLDCSFNEGFVSLSLSGPLGKSTTSRSKLKSNAEVTRTPWHDFLNHLSWLGGHKCGCKTITSISAEALAQDLRFWGACNQKSQMKSLQHLKWILAN